MSRLRVSLRGDVLALDDALLIGAGGEARVYRHPDPRVALALKVFHPLEAALPPHERALRERLAALRAEKLAVFPSFLPRLPASVVAPAEVLLDAAARTGGGARGGDIVGYAMARVDGAQDIAVLAHKQKKHAAGFTQAAVLALFRELARALDALHAAGVVVGDLNDGNVVLAAASSAAHGAPSACFIDADSMQLGALPCPVAHERFLDPRLYGLDLVDAARFDADSDRYALRVLLFQSLLCVHPYGGVHAKHATLLRRAEARWSLLRGDVQVPRAAVPFATLPDELLHDFARCFDDGARLPVDARALAARFTTCSCGVEHARRRCPACATTVQAPAVRTSGGVREESVLEARGGLVVCACVVAGQLAYVVSERATGDGREGRLVRETREVVADDPRASVAIAGDATWVARGSALVKVRGGRVVDSARTATVGGAAVFAAGAAGLFVVEGDVLVHHETRARVGRVVEGRTRIVASPHDGGLAWFRAGRLLVAYRFGARSFCDAELPQPPGKLVELDASFAESGACLVGLASDHDGKRVHTLALIDVRGRLVASASGAPESAPFLEAIGGKLVVAAPGLPGGVKILSASSAGVVAVEVAPHAGPAGAGALTAGALVAGATYPDTQPFVDASTALLPGTGGSLLVVAPHAITQLRLSGKST